MGTVTAWLERSLQKCSLNQSSSSSILCDGGGGGGGGGIGIGVGRSSSSDSFSDDILKNNNNNHEQQQQQQRRDSVTHRDDNSGLIQLNSHLPLPYHWEQCLDLKTGELYYINWRTGMKAKEDPRTIATGYNGDYYSEEEEEEDEDDDDDEDEESSLCDSEGSLTETSSSCWSSRQSFRRVKNGRHIQQQVRQDAVLVVAGCKSCLMYYMLPKHVLECPKCSGQLLHFPANHSSP